MGGGAFANTGFAHAAYQRLIFYIDTNEASQWASLTTAQPSPSCYTILFTPASGGSWGSYFYFGGPGGNSC
jgi:hypothetical protein